MTRLLLILASCGLLSAQTAYLRYGGLGSYLTVTNATNATPIVVTTSTAHGYSAGDLVEVHGIGGNTAANGIWKVASPGSTTFALTTLADANSVGNGAYIYCSDWNCKPGFVGRVQATTLPAHPRGWLGNSALSSFLLDPDGAGASVATALTENAAWVTRMKASGLDTVVGSYSTYTTDYTVTSYASEFRGGVFALMAAGLAAGNYNVVADSVLITTVTAASDGSVSWSGPTGSYSLVQSGVISGRQMVTGRAQILGKAVLQ